MLWRIKDAIRGKTPDWLFEWVRKRLLEMAETFRVWFWQGLRIYQARNRRQAAKWLFVLPFRISMVFLGPLLALLLSLRESLHPTRFRVEERSADAPHAARFTLVSGATARRARALATTIGPEGCQNGVFLCNDIKAQQALQKQGLKAYMLRDLPFIDKHFEIRLSQQSFDFVERLVGTLRGVSYHGADLADLARVRITDRDRVFRLVAGILDAAVEQGCQDVYWCFGQVPRFHRWALALAKQKGLKTRVIRPEGDRGWEEEDSPVQQEENLTSSRLREEVLLSRQIDHWLGQAIRKKTNWFQPLLLRAGYPDRYFSEVTARRYTADPDRGREPAVLVVTQAYPGSIYWTALQPVLRALKQRCTPVVAITERGTTVQAIRDMGIDAYRVPIAPPDPMLRTRMVKVLKFADRLRTAAAAGQLPPGDGEPARPFRPCEQALLNGLAECLSFRMHMVRTMRSLVFLGRLIGRIKPGSILAMPHSSELAAEAIAAARQHGVPSVSMPSVTVAGHRRSLSHWDMDLIACYGTQAVDAYTAVGYPAEKLVVTGSAAMDRLHEIDPKPAARKVKRECNWDFGKKMFLVATSRIDPDENRWLRAMVARCRQRGDCGVVIKVHPSFGEEDYADVCEPGDKPFVRVVTDADLLYPLIGSCDVLVTDYSTVGAEAAILDKPLIVVNMLGVAYPSNNYDEYGIALAARSLQDLPQLVDTLMDDASAKQQLAEKRKTFIDMYNYRNDGHAAERVCDILIQPQRYLDRSMNSTDRQAADRDTPVQTPPVTTNRETL